MTKGVLTLGALVLVVVTMATTERFNFEPTVTLKQDGFHPRSLAVDVGERVRFVNRSGHALWVASDNHPLHDMNPEFDAGRPVADGTKWEFVFDEPGVWWFHDHLRPYFRGRIVVGNADTGVNCIDSISTETSIGDKQACWERELTFTLEEQGASAAYELFVELYQDPDFSVVGCHSMAHKLGEAEYGIFLRHRDLSQLEFPPETAYCGYGYYHGFIEHYLRDNPDYSLADRFCRSLVASLEDSVPRIRLNCYHSIGHGFVPEPVDIEVWGNPKALVAPALAACQNIPDHDAREECYQGAFNVIADWMWNDQFGLEYPEDEPLSICTLFEDAQVSDACYYEVAMRLNPLVQNDFLRAYEKYIAAIPNEKTAGTVLNSFAASALGARIVEDDFSDLVLECRQLPAFLQVDCMKGLTGAFIAHGEPEREYEKAIAFCSMGFLTEKEEDVCWWNVVRTFKGVYTPQKVAKVCSLVEAPYQKYCAYE